MKGRNYDNQSLKDVIETWLAQYKHLDMIYEGKVLSLWDGIVGPVISKETDHMFIKNKVLMVKLKSDALRYEMEFSRKKLVKLINTKAGRKVIDDVIFI